VREGDLLEVHGPSGSMTVPPGHEARQLVLIAGGSGITPLMSIARTVLAREPASHVSLIYGNRDEASIIFRDALAGLEREHAGRLSVHHVLETPPADWRGGTGRLDRAILAAWLDRRPSALPETRFFICGPEPMMEEARAELAARGIPQERIREERFTRPQPTAGSTPGSAAGPQPLHIQRPGSTRDVLVPAGSTLLEAGLAAGVPLPFSCTVGGCGSCRVRLVSGRVELEEPNCLSAEERAAGYVLACVARPTEPCTIEPT
jgi:ring-1,2-phenylacetyl-CoA epoxidase subunit PaaE